MTRLGIVDAISALHPTAQFTTNNGKIEEWHSSEITQPTEEEIEVKFAELKTAEPIRLLREERNQRLAETDWTQGRDVSLSNDTDWKNYRQALRDLPSKSNPKLDSVGDLDMSSVTWPTKPSS